MELFLILLLGYIFQAQNFLVGSSIDIIGSIILLSVLGCVLLAIIFHAIIFVRKFIRNVQRVEKIRNEEHLTLNPMMLGKSDEVSMASNPLAETTDLFSKTDASTTRGEDANTRARVASLFAREERKTLGTDDDELSYGFVSYYLLFRTFIFLLIDYIPLLLVSSL